MRDELGLARSGFSRDALTPYVLKDLVAMMEFGWFSGSFDVRVKGLGVEMLISEEARKRSGDGLLKSSAVNKYLGDVSFVAQGEVIKFGANAVHQLSKAGRYVMVEGPVSE